MNALLTRRRMTRLFGVASAQAGVQVLGFAAGIVLVRAMAPAQYGLYTLAIAMVGVANVLTELGIGNAVLALGGRLTGQGASLRGLVADADALHGRLVIVLPALVLPAFAVLLLHQHASVAQTIVLAMLGGACAVFNVRNVIAQSVARLTGDLALQQKLDLAMNAARVLLLAIASALVLDAAVASAVNLAVAALGCLVWRRWIARRLGAAITPSRVNALALRASVWRQAPNCIYYVFNSQLTVWLVGIFGSAERVADVGALGRLGAGFAVVTSVIGGVVLPYFARTEEAPQLESGFVALNGFFALLATALVATALLAPAPILWVLGPHYAGLHAELVWMVLATAFSAWAGALYTVGCARGWVLPGTLGIGLGLVATLVGLRCFDLATVSGNFKLNTLTAFVALAVNVGFFGRRLLRHRRDAMPVFRKALP
jgi:O-antigen/teichoic acid export membrane protein